MRPAAAPLSRAEVQEGTVFPCASAVISGFRYGLENLPQHEDFTTFALAGPYISA